MKNLDKARDFHELLVVNKERTRHRNTFVHYGTDDEGFRAFGTVTWQFSGSGQLQGNPLESTKFADDPSGGVTLQDVISASVYMPRFKLSDRRDEAGDGTVPIGSASALNEKVELVAEHTGYDHQGSYGSGQVQELTAYGIARLVADYA